MSIPTKTGLDLPILRPLSIQKQVK